MEDRCSSRLFLELRDASAADGASRAAALLQTPGVLRASWWSNCVPGRTELPMRIPDGTLLLVAELDDDAEAPQAIPGSTAFSFRRHARPSQGILSGEATTGLLVVWISPRSADLTQSLRDWGDFVHIRHIAAAGIPGFTQISVYENETAPDPLYMHLYEFVSEDAEATYQTMVDHVGPRLGGAGSEPFDEWADWRRPGGRLWYCNTFNVAGEASRERRRTSDGASAAALS